MTDRPPDRSDPNGNPAGEANAEDELGQLIEAALEGVQREHHAAINQLSTELQGHEVETAPEDRDASTPAPHPGPSPARPAMAVGGPTRHSPSLEPIEPAPPIFFAVGADEQPRDRHRVVIVIIAFIILAVILLLGWRFLASGRSAPSADLPQVAATEAPARSTTATSVPAVAPSRDAAATARPTPGAPQAAAGASPTAVPLVVATPVGTPLPAVDSVAQKAASFIAGIRSGEMQISYDYGGGTTSTANLLFDLGDSAHPQRLHMQTVYKSPQGSQDSDSIVIGSDAWEARNGSGWSRVAPTSVWEQANHYLPTIPASQEITEQHGSDGTRLQWLDGSNQVTLLVDEKTGAPKELRRLDQQHQLLLVVAYARWNSPVDINAP